MRYILHADDDHTDRWDFKYLVNTIDPSINVLGFTNGLELMQYLGGISDQLLPSLIFLDLRMPIWDGPKTLQAIKNEPRLMSIPVYIWSIADTNREMQLCLKLGAEKFLTKPTTQEEHMTIRKFISTLLGV
ncbi:MAG TPA: response regulator [Flavitalea sp.]|nr:response regulator [Flavitalea sp.]